jgi:hypothetical protein
MKMEMLQPIAALGFVLLLLALTAVVLRGGWRPALAALRRQAQPQRGAELRRIASLALTAQHSAHLLECASGRFLIVAGGGTCQIQPLSGAASFSQELGQALAGGPNS